jgi:hypothetical protein
VVRIIGMRNKAVSLLLRHDLDRADGVLINFALQTLSNNQTGIGLSRIAVADLRDQSIKSYFILLKNNSITSVQ